MTQHVELIRHIAGKLESVPYALAEKIPQQLNAAADAHEAQAREIAERGKRIKKLEDRILQREKAFAEHDAFSVKNAMLFTADLEIARQRVAELEAQLAAREPSEPVGEIAEAVEHGIHFAPYVVWPPVGTRLYTHPVPRQLSDEEKIQIYDKVRSEHASVKFGDAFAIEYARAILAAAGAPAEDKRDAKRLDWLEANHTLHTSVQALYVVDGYELVVERDGDWQAGPYRGETLRAAIDAAMQKGGAA